MAKRRPKGGGSFYETTTKAGTVVICYQKQWKDENGERQSVRGQGASEAEALERFNVLMEERTTKPKKKPTPRRTRKPRTLSGNLSLTEYIPLRDKRRIETGRATYVTCHKDRQNIENHLPEAMREKPLRAITAEELRRHFLNLEGKIGESARLNVYKSLNSLFNDAVKRGDLKLNPLRMTDRPVVKKKFRQVEFSGKIEDVRAVIRSIIEGTIEDNQAALRLRLALLGLRPSEILGLRWSKVDLAEGTMTIDTQLTRYDADEPQTGLYLKPRTKTGVARIIPFDKEIYNLFVEWSIEQLRHQQSSSWRPLTREGMDDLVFTTPTGKPIRHDDDRQNWKDLLESQGFNYFPPNELRHVAATLLRDSGAPDSLVANLLGHSVEVENRTYYHPQTESQAPYIEGLSETLKQDPKAERLKREIMEADDITPQEYEMLPAEEQEKYYSLSSGSTVVLYHRRSDDAIKKIARYKRKHNRLKKMNPLKKRD